jgi:hypothetical protein
MSRHVVSGRGRVVTLGAALVAVVSAVTVASASTKFDYTTSIDDTGELAIAFEEVSLKRFDGVAYRLDATGTLVSQDRVLGAIATVETESPLLPDTRGRVTGSLATTLHLLELTPCGCEGGRYVEYTGIALSNLATAHVYRLDSIRRDV